LTAAFLAHEVITQLDLRWAITKRPSLAAEQHVHSFLTAVPFATLILVWLISARDFSFALKLRSDPVPWPLIAAILASMTVFGAIPYWEEFWRCLKQARRTGHVMQAA
jgi:hypothetical protein